MYLTLTAAMHMLRCAAAEAVIRLHSRTGVSTPHTRSDTFSAQGTKTQQHPIRRMQKHIIGRSGSFIIGTQLSGQVSWGTTCALSTHATPDMEMHHTTMPGGSVRQKRRRIPVMR